MKSLKRYRKYEVTLHDDQNSELLKVVSSISDIGKDELEKVLEEADAKGKGEILRKIWKLDVEERLKYHEDQKKNGMFNYFWSRDFQPIRCIEKCALNHVLHT